MEKRYESSGDVRLRLDHSFVTYRGEHYYAQVMNRDQHPEDTTITLLDVCTRKAFRVIDANDSDLDITSLSLGYCETEDWHRCVFLSRAPYRRQKQGVSAENCVFYDCFLEGARGIDNEFMTTKAFKKMLKGEYTKYSGVIHSIIDGKEKLKQISRPFSRNFAVVYEKEKTFLQHNTTNIGGIDLDTGLVHLNPEHNHSVFTMKLAELGVPVA